MSSSRILYALVFSPGPQLASSGAKLDDGEDHHAFSLEVAYRVLHGRAIPDAVGVVGVGVQSCKRDVDYRFSLRNRR